jgi:hypothetical protein
MAKVIHVRKFGASSGGLTPQEMHAKYAWPGKKCLGCGGPPAIRIRVLSPVREMAHDVLMLIAASNPASPGTLPVIPTKFGPFLKTSDTFACAACAPAAERSAAHLPSWVIVEIERGPQNTMFVGWDGEPVT